MARELVLQGASVFICSRSASEVDATVDELKREKISKDQRIHGLRCDISKTADVDVLHDEITNKFGGLNVLINNAGVYGPMDDLVSVDWKSWRQAIEINLFGPVYITKKFLPHFIAARSGKIINLSGGGATSPMPGLSSYAVAKAGLVRFSETVAKELEEFGVDINCVAPGALNTRLLDEVLLNGRKTLNADFLDKMRKIKDAGGTDLSLGARCICFLASPDCNGVTGRLISAVWDDWANIDDYKAMLNDSDVYTLRRITAKDRRANWGDLAEPNS